MVQAHRTSSNPLKTHERARCVEVYHRSSDWFKHIEPHRTPSNNMIAYRAIFFKDRVRCVEFCHLCSGWFKHIEPHRTPSNNMIAYRAIFFKDRVRCVEFCHLCSVGSSTANLIEPPQNTCYMILERARCVEFCHISAGWFKHIEHVTKLCTPCSLYSHSF